MTIVNKMKSRGGKMKINYGAGQTISDVRHRAAMHEVE